METSQFWKYRIFTSKRQRNNFRAGEKVESKFSKTIWCGPFAFCSKINELEFRKWIREHLGVKTEHIECVVSDSEKQNKKSLNTLAFHLSTEIRRNTEKNILKNGARPGNLIIKWINPLPTRLEISEERKKEKRTVFGIAAI